MCWRYTFVTTSCPGSLPILPIRTVPSSEYERLFVVRHSYRSSLSNGTGVLTHFPNKIRKVSFSWPRACFYTTGNRYHIASGIEGSVTRQWRNPVASKRGADIAVYTYSRVAPIRWSSRSCLIFCKYSVIGVSVTADCWTSLIRKSSVGHNPESAT